MHITSLIVDTLDYFSAHLENGGVRVGLYGEAFIDIPSYHSQYSVAVSCTTSEEVEEVFDTLYGQ